MYQVFLFIDGRRDIPSEHQSREDAIRYVTTRVEELTKSRFGDRFQFEIVSDNGHRWWHDDIMQEIVIAGV